MKEDNKIYYKQFYTCKLDNLDETNQFSTSTNYSNLSNLIWTRPTAIKLKIFPQKRNIQASIKCLRRINTNSVHFFFQKIEEKEYFLTYSIKPRIPKSD